MSDSAQEGGIKWMLEHLEKALRNRFSAKILWGNRSIYKPDWIQLKKFIHEYNIKTVLEYGVGLSTELMQLEGCEITSLETIEWWANVCKKAIGNNIIVYKEGHPPEIDGFFDLAFVDGPQTKRTATILHAKKYSNIIYLHDLRPSEVELMSDWNIIEKYGKHFYEKPESKCFCRCRI